MKTLESLTQTKTSLLFHYRMFSDNLTTSSIIESLGLEKTSMENLACLKWQTERQPWDAVSVQRGVNPLH